MKIRILILAYSLNIWSNLKSNAFAIKGKNINILPTSTVFNHLAEYDNPWYERVT